MPHILFNSVFVFRPQAPPSRRDMTPLRAIALRLREVVFATNVAGNRTGILLLVGLSPLR